MYVRSFLDADAYLPERLPRDHLRDPPLVALKSVVEAKEAPDAVDTIMLELAARRDISSVTRLSEQSVEAR